MCYLRRFTILRYGRSGYLYLLRNSRHAFPDEPAYNEVRTLLTDAMEQIAERILKGAEANGGKWFWHGKEYSGPAHGTIGIITQIALSCPSLRPQLETRLISLLHDQLESGNWKSSASSSHEDRLVQWCHGAPGFIPALITLKPLYPHLAAQIDVAIEKGRRCIWERGLLRKTPGLCHGMLIYRYYYSIYSILTLYPNVLCDSNLFLDGSSMRLSANSNFCLK